MPHKDGQESSHCVRTVHAEQNALCQAAKLGVPIDGATLYCRMTPCRVCAMLIINCGIQRVVCERKYHAGAESEAMFRQAGIALGNKWGQPPIICATSSASRSRCPSWECIPACASRNNTENGGS